ncbi:cdc42 effector protein 1 [Lampris incognitus]|uniref:cdc42 effector protein 1 n=1 Tax=Lampris incognitus TaxID=2546036 RepID=UPI0024B4E9AE|nr:cdc42 effector protein 1 [Lampris incognitus]
MNLQRKLSGLVSPSRGKRRFKGDLTTEMISPPLGDFRHTMHVGRGGDVFGDTSFLSNYGGIANGGASEPEPSASPDNKIGAFFSRTFRQVRKGSDNRPREGSKDLFRSVPAISPIIKNAVSFHRLDTDMPDGSPAVLFPSAPSSPEGTKGSYGLESGFVTLPRLSRSERQQPSISISNTCSPDVHPTLTTDANDTILSSCSAPVMTSDPYFATMTRTTAHSDSLPSLTSLDTFTFDLGPSLMSEVLGLIDSPDSQSGEPGHTWGEGEEAGSACGLTNEGSEMDSATISYVDSLLREDCESRKSPYGVEWEEDEARATVEANGAGQPLRGVAPDVVMGSPSRERGEREVGGRMDSDRFQNATDVLARHYGMGRHLKGQVDAAESDVMFISQAKKKTSYSYTDEDEEIKV